MDEQKQPQEETLAKDGAVTPQPEAEAPKPGAEGLESGTETTAQPKPEEQKAEQKTKSFTQDEVDKIISERTSTIQKETQRWRDTATRLTMENQLATLQAQERQAQVKDTQDVENGVLTQQEAEQRKQARQELANMQVTLRQQREQGEATARILAAQDIAKQYGVNPEELIKDLTLQNPLMMVQQAAKLALDAKNEELRKVKAQPEKFDKGPGEGGEGISDEKFLEEYAAGNKNSSADHKRARKILANLS